MRADTILDELFPACALAAFVEQARAQRGWPDSELTRVRAYRLYEEALAEKNQRVDTSNADQPASREPQARTPQRDD